MNIPRSSALLPSCLARRCLVPAQAQPAPAATPVAVPANPDTGFVAIYDGETLAGGEGAAKYGRVEPGCLAPANRHADGLPGLQAHSGPR